MFHGRLLDVIKLLTNETVLAAIVGGVVASVVSYILAVATERRRQTREARHAIIGELATVGHNYLAGLQELQAAKESQETGSVRSWLAQLTRLDGNLVAIQLRLWHVFPQRRVRAATSRFLSPAPKSEDGMSKAKKNTERFTVCVLPIHQAKSFFFC